jgi:hypothetical protein
MTLRVFGPYAESPFCSLFTDFLPNHEVSLRTGRTPNNAKHDSFSVTDTSSSTAEQPRQRKLRGDPTGETMCRLHEPDQMIIVAKSVLSLSDRET